MGVCYYLVDPNRRIGLDVHKAPALAQACGHTSRPRTDRPLSLEQVEASAGGWWMPESLRMRDPHWDKPQDVEHARRMAEMVGGWMRAMGPGNWRLAADWCPWEKDPSGWELWTFYVHPLTGKPDDGLKLWAREG